MPHGNVRLDRTRRSRHFTQMLLYDGPKAAPNPRRVRIYLAEKGIDVPRREIALMEGEHRSPEYLAKYPAGQIPALELDDGRVIGETIAICRYFEALHPEPPLFGVDPADAAEIEMWIRRIEFGLGMAIRHIWVHTHPITARLVPHQYKDFGESNREVADRAMRFIDKTLQTRDWLAGDFSMADITLLTLIDFGIFIGLPIPDDCNALKDWHCRISARPSAQA